MRDVFEGKVRYWLLSLFFLLLPFTQVDAQAPKEIPNIFTPNDDGVNDYFELESTSELTLMVFSRNGGLVYQVEAKHIKWDGKDERGNELADGVYFFVLKDPAKTYNTEKGFLYISRISVK